MVFMEFLLFLLPLFLRTAEPSVTSKRFTGTAGITQDYRRNRKARLKELDHNALGCENLFELEPFLTNTSKILQKNHN